MITPPLSTPSFYSAIFEKPAAKFVIGLVAESFAKNDDIDQVMVTSQNFISDVQATTELQASTREVLSHLVNETPEVESRFNPLFLPQTNDLYEIIEINEEGDVVSVDGFNNPYHVMTLKIDTENHKNIINAKVIYKQFDLPPILIAANEAHKEVLLS